MATDPLDEIKAAVLGPIHGLGEVVKDAPRLVHRVQELESDRRALLDAVSARPLDHRREAELTQELTAYRQRSADVLYQAYGIDLGGET